MNEIYRELGELKSDVSNIKETSDKHYDLLVVINDKLGVFNTDKVLMKAQLDALHLRQDATDKDIQEVIKPKIAWCEMIIGRAIWVGSGIVTLITIALNYIPSLLSRFIP